MKIFWLNENDKQIFKDLFVDANGVGTCFCTAWHARSWDDWDSSNTNANLDKRNMLFRQHIYDGIIAVEKGRVVGWCQVLNRNSSSLLCSMYGTGEENGAALTCFFVLPRYRRQGVGTALVNEALTELKRRNYLYVHAFPIRNVHSPEECWTGPERMYISMGFKVVDDNNKLPILEYRL